MSLPTPPPGRKGLVSLTLFGFPVTIHTSFLVIVALLGYRADTGVSGALVWVVVVTVSVIAHELGHAAVAAPVGGNPRIDLYMLAGLTTWRPGRASRSRRVAVSFAGPLFGVAFGLALLVVFRLLDPVPNSLVDQALVFGIFANLAWGVLNLLPMLPLDGGQVLYALMPGDDTARLRRTSVVSLAVAALVALAALAVKEVFGAVVVVMFAAGNAQTLVALRKPAQGANPVALADRALTSGDPAEALALLPDPATVGQAALPAVLLLRSAALLRLGRYREAQEALLGLPQGFRLDPAFEAAVLVANGQDRLAYERLVPALPYVNAWGVRELVLLLVQRGDDVDRWLAGLATPAAGGAAMALYATGRYTDAARWGEVALAAGERDHHVAFNLACAYALAGDQGRALDALGRAVGLGLDDASHLDDPDLAALRGRPEVAGLRARMMG